MFSAQVGSNIAQGNVMSRHRVIKPASGADNRSDKSIRVQLSGKAGLEGAARRERALMIFIAAVLLILGAYHSVLYFGHTVVPIGDFPAFYHVGHELWSLKAPSNYKRGPLLGLLQVPLARLVGGQYPDLTAGWLLNAMLHPLNLILLWLVGREIVGKSAVWFAIIAAMNPWVLYMLTEPIVETTLLFFILLTFYLIFRRSNWCYLFASMATMVRYEGMALIAAAFVMDMIYAESKRERIRALLYSALASVPLAIWMSATFLTWRTQTSSSHYLKIFGANSEYSKLLLGSYKDKVGIVLNMKLLWSSAFQPLLTPGPGAGADVGDTIQKLSKFFAAGGFFFGCIYGLYKRQWNMLALLIFFMPYFVIHAMFPAPLLRYHMPISWMALLTCWFGLHSLWALIDKNGRVPRIFVFLPVALLSIIALVWVADLFQYLPKLAPVSPTSSSVPYVAMAAALLILSAGVYFKQRRLPGAAAVFVLLGLVFISNQFGLVYTLGDGQREIEFKLLADWFVANAKPGEKIGLYMAEVVRIFAPKRADSIVGLPKADNQSEFVAACYKEGVTYVVWATREGLSSDHADYRGANLDKNLASLQNPKSAGPYQFVTQVGTKRGYVNVFRLIRQD